MAYTCKSQAVKGVDANQVLIIVAQLLPLVLQYGIPMITKVIQAIQEDPNLPQEALKETFLKRIEEASALNNAIINE